MFNIFKRTPKQTDTQPALVPEEQNVGKLLIITAATNFGLVVMPESKKPIMFKMEPADTIATCVTRNAPSIASAVDVSTCLVLELSAELPNHTRAANKIYALVLPDPGILINQNMVVVGYEEIDTVPGATNSMLKMLVKQVPKEYFAETQVEAGQHNSAPAATAQSIAAPQPAAPKQEQPAAAVQSAPAVEPAEQPVVVPAPENPSQTS